MASGEEIAYMVSEGVIAALAVFGNTLVILAVIKYKNLRTVTNSFVVSLSIADLLVGLIAIPCAIITYYGYPHHSFYGCLFLNSLVVIMTQTSIFGMLAIAIERFLAIKHPFFYTQYFTKNIAIIVILISWIAAVVIGCVPLFGWNLGNTDNRICAFTNVISMEYMVYFNFFACVLTPLFIVFAIYAYIFQIVNVQIRRIAALEFGVAQGKNRKLTKNYKAAKALAVIVAFFAICWLPLHILNTFTLLCPKACEHPFRLLLFTILLSHFNSAVNPLLYARGSTGFRNAFRNFLCPCSQTSWEVNNSTFGNNENTVQTINVNMLNTIS